jgi:hypothetical protein
MLGALAASSAVKNHWFGFGCGARCGLEAAGDGALLRESGRGGDVLEVCVGGEGTAGGTSRRLVGDLESRSTLAGMGLSGREGG